MFVHMLSLLVIRPHPCGSPNQVARTCVFVGLSICLFLGLNERERNPEEEMGEREGERGIWEREGDREM